MAQVTSIIHTVKPFSHAPDFLLNTLCLTEVSTDEELVFPNPPAPPQGFFQVNPQARFCSITQYLGYRLFASLVSEPSSSCFTRKKRERHLNTKALAPETATSQATDDGDGVSSNGTLLKNTAEKPTF